MSRERKRERKEVIEPGIPIAKPGDEVIWNDPKLKTSFISNPFISRLKGSATLDQMLAYNLYFDDITQKWKPLSDLAISTVKNLGRYYTADPEAPTEQSDLYMRLTAKHELRTNDLDVIAKLQELIDMY